MRFLARTFSPLAREIARLSVIRGEILNLSDRLQAAKQLNDALKSAGTEPTLKAALDESKMLVRSSLSSLLEAATNGLLLKMRRGQLPKIASKNDFWNAMQELTGMKFVGNSAFAREVERGFAWHVDRLVEEAKPSAKAATEFDYALHVIVDGMQTEIGRGRVEAKVHNGNHVLTVGKHVPSQSSSQFPSWASDEHHILLTPQNLGEQLARIFKAQGLSAEQQTAERDAINAVVAGTSRFQGFIAYNPSSYPVYKHAATNPLPVPGKPLEKGQLMCFSEDSIELPLGVNQNRVRFILRVRKV